ncbi:MAG: marine proteobacterial sortase target protein [Pseudomonadota bacterium]
MQDWLRQRNTVRKARALTFWTSSAAPGARFRARLRALARGSAALLVAAAGVAAPAPDAWASGAPTTGSLMMRTESGEQPLPHLEATFDITVSGPVARTTLKQRFQNTSADFIEAVYRFPLPDDAAVDHLTVEAGGQRIIGEIREREKARKEYRKARAAGQRAALVSTARANLFTTALANVGPGEVVTVEIEYQQRVTREGERYRLRVPTAVTPRYEPAARSGEFQVHKVATAATTAVPAANLAPGSHALFVNIDLDVGLPLADIVSRHHRIDVTRGAGTSQHVTVTGEARLDADFILEWQPRGAADTQVAAFGHMTGEAGYALVQLVPPMTTDANLAPPRELILVLDTSGSMQGASIIEAVAAVTHAIDALRPVDRFNLIAFDNYTQQLFQAPRMATPENRAEALQWLKTQRADGGTEMRPALMAALRGARSDGYLRQVIFVTDGAVGNEADLFRDIEGWIGASRLFTVGIGAAPNGWFMRKAAECGRGSFVLIGNAGGVTEGMGTLFERMAQPVLTDVSFDWGGAGVEAYPSHIADLYAGEPIEVSARFDGAPPARVSVSGTQWVGGVGMPWAHEITLAGARDRSRHGVAVTWARDKLESLDDARRAGLPDELARAAMLEVALSHHIVSEVTSLVAVEATPVRTAGPVRSSAVPGLLPRGATPLGQFTATGTRAPLQRLVGGLALALALWLAVLRRVFRPQVDVATCRA